MSSTTPGSEPLDGDAVPERENPDATAAPDEPGPVDEPGSIDEPRSVDDDPSADEPPAEHEAASADSGDVAAPAASAPGDADVVAAVEASESAPAGPTGTTGTNDADASPASALEEPEPVGPADTSALDAAVLRANAGHEASATEAGTGADAVDDADGVPQPVPADAVRRETYVPPSAAATAGAVGAATLAPAPDEPFAPPAHTVYVQAPEPPRAKGNRAFGLLVALIGSALFALLYAGVAYLLLLTTQVEAAAVNEAYLERFLARPVYWVPIVAFFIGFALLAAIINRGRWWAYVVFGVLVGALVYFSYIGGALLTVEAWTLTFDEAASFVSQRWLDPFAIVAAVIAREIPIWLGGWIAARGRTVAERNREALEAYDRELAAGPQARV